MHAWSVADLLYSAFSVTAMLVGITPSHCPTPFPTPLHCKAVQAFEKGVWKCREADTEKLRRASQKKSKPEVTITVTTFHMFIKLSHSDAIHKTE